MRQKTQRPDSFAPLTAALYLDVAAEALGLRDGYQRVYGSLQTAGQKRKARKRPEDDSFVLTYRNTDEGACVCELTARRDVREWETVPPCDYFRYTDALVLRFLAAVKEKDHLDLLPHITDAHIRTPLDNCLAQPEKATEKLLKSAGKVFPERQEMRVTRRREYAGLILLTLERTDGYTAAIFRAGQYVQLAVETPDGQATAPCLLCSSPALTREGRYDAVLSCRTDGAAWADALAPGAAVTVSAPRGSFCYSVFRDRRTVIGLADRHGAAAFLSMAAAIRDGLEKFKLTVLYWETEQEDFPFPEAFAEICGACGKVRLVRFPADSVDETLSVDALKTCLPHETYSVFICGAQPFQDAALQALQPLKLSPKYLRAAPSEALFGQEEAHSP